MVNHHIIIHRAKTDVWNAVYGGGVTGGKIESQS